MSHLERPVRVALASGWTAGHAFTAISIARAVAALEPGAEFLFFEHSGAQSPSWAEEAGYPVESLWVSGFERGWSPGGQLGNLVLPLKLLVSGRQARRALSRFRPHVAVGVGGFVSEPVLRQARGLGVPTLIHEQNAIPGLANRLLARTADTVCLGMGLAEGTLQGKRTVVTGIPIRQEVTERRDDPHQALGLDPTRGTIAVLGGSLGNRWLNDAVLAQRALIEESQYQWLWQCGDGDYDRCAAAVAGVSGIRVFPFFDSIADVYSAAEVIVSAAGAISIAELAARGKPTVIVPSPTATEGHQTKNAQALAEREAVIYVPAAQAMDKALSAAVELLADPRRRADLGTRLAELTRADADTRVAREVLRLASPSLGAGGAS